MKLSDYDIDKMTASEASQIGPFGRGDKPVDITCYGRLDHWKSRKAALRYFRLAMLGTEGSERDRYCNIYLALEAGQNPVSDCTLW